MNLCLSWFAWWKHKAFQVSKKNLLHISHTFPTNVNYLMLSCFVVCNYVVIRKPEAKFRKKRLKRLLLLLEICYERNTKWDLNLLWNAVSVFNSFIYAFPQFSFSRAAFSLPVAYNKRESSTDNRPSVL